MICKCTRQGFHLGYAVIGKRGEQIGKIVALCDLSCQLTKMCDLLFTENVGTLEEFLQIFCYHFAMLPIQSILEQAYKALGRSDIMLILFFVEKLLGIAVVLITMQFGVQAIAWGMVFSTSFDTLFHISFAKKTLNYSLLELLKNVGNTFFCCILMLAAVLGGLMAIVLFTVLPTAIVGGVGAFVPLGRWPRVVLEAVLKVAVFVLKLVVFLS